MLPHLTRGAFSLDEWLVEPELNRVTRHESSVHLEPKIMEVLVHLATYAPDVVPRRVLVDEVWDGGYIADNTLTHAVAELRRSLGDDAGHPTYIETVHRRGYRLLVSAVPLDDSSPIRRGKLSSFSVWLDGRTVHLREGVNLIGRLPDAALSIATPQVSRRHAQITARGMRAFLEDLGSTNGTWLNGHLVIGTEPLANGDRIVLGDGVAVMQIVERGDLVSLTPIDDRTPTRPTQKVLT